MKITAQNHETSRDCDFRNHGRQSRAFHLTQTRFPIWGDNQMTPSLMLNCISASLKSGLHMLFPQTSCRVIQRSCARRLLSGLQESRPNLGSAHLKRVKKVRSQKIGIVMIHGARLHVKAVVRGDQSGVAEMEICKGRLRAGDGQMIWGGLAPPLMGISEVQVSENPSQKLQSLRD